MGYAPTRDRSPPLCLEGSRAHPVHAHPSAAGREPPAAERRRLPL